MYYPKFKYIFTCMVRISCFVFMPLCYRDGMISSEELVVFDVQDIDPSYYYHAQHIDQVNYYYYYCLWCCMPDVVMFTVC